MIQGRAFPYASTKTDNTLNSPLSKMSGPFNPESLALRRLHANESSLG